MFIDLGGKLHINGVGVDDGLGLLVGERQLLHHVLHLADAHDGLVRLAVFHLIDDNVLDLGLDSGPLQGGQVLSRHSEAIVTQVILDNIRIDHFLDRQHLVSPIAAVCNDLHRDLICLRLRGRLGHRLGSLRVGGGCGCIHGRFLCVVMIVGLFRCEDRCRQQGEHHEQHQQQRKQSLHATILHKYFPP